MNLTDVKDVGVGNYNINNVVFAYHILNIFQICQFVVNTKYGIRELLL